MRKAVIFASLPILILFSSYAGVGKRKYDYRSAQMDASSAFARTVADLCDIEPKNIEIRSVMLTINEDGAGYYYSAKADVFADGRSGKIYGEVYNTLSIFGYKLNGTDVTGIDFHCHKI